MFYLGAKNHKSLLFRIVALNLLAIFFSQSILPPSYAQNFPVLPAPGTMVASSPAFVPVLLKGIKVHPDNPFEFDFLLDSGHSKLQGEELKSEGMKLIKYFMASLALPEEDLWVNLSPYEQERIISPELAKTEMGRDLLAQDYLLKQLTASLIYPEKDLGKKFWERIYREAKERYGVINVPVETFHKVWIVPDKAVVYESDEAGFVTESRLKVMMEEDYLAASGQQKTEKKKLEKEQVVDRSTLSAQILKELILPEIEREVNEGQNFIQLRQMYHSLILAAWFKEKLKESVLAQVYADQKKVSGIDTESPDVKEKIYQQYLEAYRKGVYNYIKEDVAPDRSVIPRKYFSGGMTWEMGDKLERRSIASAGPKISALAATLIGASLILVASFVAPGAARGQPLPAVSSVNQIEVISPEVSQGAPAVRDFKTWQKEILARWQKRDKTVIHEIIDGLKDPNASRREAAQKAAVMLHPGKGAEADYQEFKAALEKFFWELKRPLMRQELAALLGQIDPVMTEKIIRQIYARPGNKDQMLMTVPHLLEGIQGRIAEEKYNGLVKELHGFFWRINFSVVSRQADMDRDRDTIPVFIRELYLDQESRVSGKPVIPPFEEATSEDQADSSAIETNIIVPILMFPPEVKPFNERLFRLKSALNHPRQQAAMEIYLPFWLRMIKGEVFDNQAPDLETRSEALRILKKLPESMLNRNFTSITSVLVETLGRLNESDFELRLFRDEIISLGQVFDPEQQRRFVRQDVAAFGSWWLRSLRDPLMNSANQHWIFEALLSIGDEESLTYIEEGISIDPQGAVNWAERALAPRNAVSRIANIERYPALWAIFKLVSGSYRPAEIERMAPLLFLVMEKGYSWDDLALEINNDEAYTGYLVQVLESGQSHPSQSAADLALNQFLSRFPPEYYSPETAVWLDPLLMKVIEDNISLGADEAAINYLSILDGRASDFLERNASRLFSVWLDDLKKNTGLLEKYYSWFAETALLSDEGLEYLNEAVLQDPGKAFLWGKDILPKVELDRSQKESYRSMGSLIDLLGFPASEEQKQRMFIYYWDQIKDGALTWDEAFELIEDRAVEEELGMDENLRADSAMSADEDPSMTRDASFDDSSLFALKSSAYGSVSNFTEMVLQRYLDSERIQVIPVADIWVNALDYPQELAGTLSDIVDYALDVQKAGKIKVVLSEEEGWNIISVVYNRRLDEKNIKQQAVKQSLAGRLYRLDDSGKPGRKLFWDRVEDMDYREILFQTNLNQTEQNGKEKGPGAALRRMRKMNGDIDLVVGRNQTVFRLKFLRRIKNHMIGMSPNSSKAPDVSMENQILLQKETVWNGEKNRIVIFKNPLSTPEIRHAFKDLPSDLVLSLWTINELNSLSNYAPAEFREIRNRFGFSEISDELRHQNFNRRLRLSLQYDLAREIALLDEAILHPGKAIFREKIFQAFRNYKSIRKLLIQYQFFREEEDPILNIVTDHRESLISLREKMLSYLRMYPVSVQKTLKISADRFSSRTRQRFGYAERLKKILGDNLKAVVVYGSSVPAKSTSQQFSDYDNWAVVYDLRKAYAALKDVSLTYRGKPVTVFLVPAEWDTQFIALNTTHMTKLQDLRVIYGTLDLPVIPAEDIVENALFITYRKLFHARRRILRHLSLRPSESMAHRRFEYDVGDSYLFLANLLAHELHPGRARRVKESLKRLLEQLGYPFPAYGSQPRENREILIKALADTSQLMEFVRQLMENSDESEADNGDPSMTVVLLGIQDLLVHRIAQQFKNSAILRINEINELSNWTEDHVVIVNMDSLDAQKNKEQIQVLRRKYPEVTIIALSRGQEVGSADTIVYIDPANIAFLRKTILQSRSPELQKLVAGYPSSVMRKKTAVAEIKRKYPALYAETKKRQLLLFRYLLLSDRHKEIIKKWMFVHREFWADIHSMQSFDQSSKKIMEEILLETRNLDLFDWTESWHDDDPQQKYMVSVDKIRSLLKVENEVDIPDLVEECLFRVIMSNILNDDSSAVAIDQLMSEFFGRPSGYVYPPAEKSQNAFSRNERPLNGKLLQGRFASDEKQDPAMETALRKADLQLAAAVLYRLMTNPSAVENGREYWDQLNGKLGVDSSEEGILITWEGRLVLFLSMLEMDYYEDALKISLPNNKTILLHTPVGRFEIVMKADREDLSDARFSVTLFNAFSNGTPEPVSPQGSDRSPVFRVLKNEEVAPDNAGFDVKTVQENVERLNAALDLYGRYRIDFGDAGGEEIEFRESKIIYEKTLFPPDILKAFEIFNAHRQFLSTAKLFSFDPKILIDDFQKVYDDLAVIKNGASPAGVKIQIGKAREALQLIARHMTSGELTAVRKLLNDKALSGLSRGDVQALQEDVKRIADRVLMDAWKKAVENRQIILAFDVVGWAGTIDPESVLLSPPKELGKEKGRIRDSMSDYLGSYHALDGDIYPIVRIVVDTVPRTSARMDSRIFRLASQRDVVIDSGLKRNGKPIAAVIFSDNFEFQSGEDPINGERVDWYAGLAQWIDSMRIVGDYRGHVVLSARRPYDEKDILYLLDPRTYQASPVEEESTLREILKGVDQDPVSVGEDPAMTIDPRKWFVRWKAGQLNEYERELAKMLGVRPAKDLVSFGPDFVDFKLPYDLRLRMVFGSGSLFIRETLNGSWESLDAEEESKYKDLLGRVQNLPNPKNIPLRSMILLYRWCAEKKLKAYHFRNKNVSLFSFTVPGRPFIVHNHTDHSNYTWKANGEVYLGLPEIEGKLIYPTVDDEHLLFFEEMDYIVENAVILPVEIKKQWRMVQIIREFMRALGLSEIRQLPKIEGDTLTAFSVLEMKDGSRKDISANASTGEIVLLDGGHPVRPLTDDELEQLRSKFEFLFKKYVVSDKSGVWKKATARRKEILDKTGIDPFHLAKLGYSAPVLFLQRRMSEQEAEKVKERKRGERSALVSPPLRGGRRILLRQIDGTVIMLHESGLITRGETFPLEIDETILEGFREDLQKTGLLYPEILELGKKILERNVIALQNGFKSLDFLPGLKASGLSVPISKEELLTVHRDGSARIFNRDVRLSDYFDQIQRSLNFYEAIYGREAVRPLRVFLQKAMTTEASQSEKPISYDGEDPAMNISAEENRRLAEILGVEPQQNLFKLGLDFVELKLAKGRRLRLEIGGGMWIKDPELEKWQRCPAEQEKAFEEIIVNILEIFYQKRSPLKLLILFYLWTRDGDVDVYPLQEMNAMLFRSRENGKPTNWFYVYDGETQEIYVWHAAGSVYHGINNEEPILPHEDARHEWLFSLMDTITAKGGIVTQLLPEVSEMWKEVQAKRNWMRSLWTEQESEDPTMEIELSKMISEDLRVVDDRLFNMIEAIKEFLWHPLNYLLWKQGSKDLLKESLLGYYRGDRRSIEAHFVSRSDLGAEDAEELVAKLSEDIESLYSYLLEQLPAEEAERLRNDFEMWRDSVGEGSLETALRKFFEFEGVQFPRGALKDMEQLSFDLKHERFHWLLQRLPKDGRRIFQKAYWAFIQTPQNLAILNSMFLNTDYASMLKNDKFVAETELEKLAFWSEFWTQMFYPSVFLDVEQREDYSLRKVFAAFEKLEGGFIETVNLGEELAQQARSKAEEDLILIRKEISRVPVQSIEEPLSGEDPAMTVTEVKMFPDGSLSDSSDPDSVVLHLLERIETLEPDDRVRLLIPPPSDVKALEKFWNYGFREDGPAQPEAMEKVFNFYREGLIASGEMRNNGKEIILTLNKSVDFWGDSIREIHLYLPSGQLRLTDKQQSLLTVPKLLQDKSYVLSNYGGEIKGAFQSLHNALERFVVVGRFPLKIMDENGKSRLLAVLSEDHELQKKYGAHILTEQEFQRLVKLTQSPSQSPERAGVNYLIKKLDDDTYLVPRVLREAFVAAFGGASVNAARLGNVEDRYQMLRKYLQQEAGKSEELAKLYQILFPDGKEAIRAARELKDLLLAMEKSFVLFPEEDIFRDPKYTVEALALQAWLHTTTKEKDHASGLLTLIYHMIKKEFPSVIRVLEKLRQEGFSGAVLDLFPLLFPFPSMEKEDRQELDRFFNELRGQPEVSGEIISSYLNGLVETNQDEPEIIRQPANLADVEKSVLARLMGHLILELRPLVYSKFESSKQQLFKLYAGHLPPGIKEKDYRSEMDIYFAQMRAIAEGQRGKNPGASVERTAEGQSVRFQVSMIDFPVIKAKSFLRSLPTLNRADVGAPTPEEEVVTFWEAERGKYKKIDLKDVETFAVKNKVAVRVGPWSYRLAEDRIVLLDPSGREMVGFQNDSLRYQLKLWIHSTINVVARGFGETTAAARLLQEALALPTDHRVDFEPGSIKIFSSSEQWVRIDRKNGKIINSTLDTPIAIPRLVEPQAHMKARIAWAIARSYLEGAYAPLWKAPTVEDVLAGKLEDIPEIGTIASAAENAHIDEDPAMAVQGEGMTRRKFLELGAVFLALPGAGKFIKISEANNPVVSSAVPTMDHFQSLSRSEGLRLLAAIEKALQEKDIPRDAAGAFLRNVFSDALFLWGRRRALEIMLAQEIMTAGELMDIVETELEPALRADALMLLGRHPGAKESAIVKRLIAHQQSSPGLDYSWRALGEIRTPEAVRYLIENAQDGSNNDAIYALGIAAVPEAVSALIRIGNEIVTRRKDPSSRRSQDKGVFIKVADALARTSSIEAEKQLLAWSWELKEVFPLEERGTMTTWQSFIYALGELGGERVLDRLLKWSEDQDLHSVLQAALVETMGKNFGADAIRPLMALYEKRPPLRSHIYRALGEAGEPETAGFLIKRSSEERDAKNLEGIIFGLAAGGQPEALEHLFKMFENRTQWPATGTSEAVARALSKYGDTAAIERLADYFGKTDDPSVRRQIIQAVAARSSQTEKFLIEWSRRDDVAGFLEELLKGLGTAGTAAATRRLIELSDNIAEDHNLFRDRNIKEAVIEGLMRSGETAAWNRFVRIVDSGLWEDAQNAMVLSSGEYLGLRPLSIFLKDGTVLKEQDEQQRNQREEFLKAFVQIHFDPQLRQINDLFDASDPEKTARAEKSVQRLAATLQGSPATLYAVLVLSLEITSHSFPLLYDAFRGISRKVYGKPDLLRYIEENFHDQFIVEFIFEMTFFGKLVEVLRGIDDIFSEERIEKFLRKPALFAKVITSGLSLKDDTVREGFVAELKSWAQKKEEFRLLIKVLYKYGKMKFLEGLPMADLPDLPDAFYGPAREWIEPTDHEGRQENVVRVGVYWDAVNTELTHYEEFPRIFSNGSRVSSRYRNFEGYEDKSSDGYYKGRIQEFGAEKVLVKRFPQTNLTVEMYLYPTVPPAAKSTHPITVTRGHIGAPGSSNYPGAVGGIRIPSHCRSVQNSDFYIRANPDNFVIPVTETARAAETNPFLYYLLEYLGTKSQWGDWETVVKYIAPHVGRSIQKYGVGQGDIGGIYAAALEKLKRERRKVPAAALGPQGSDQAMTAQQVQERALPGGARLLAPLDDNQFDLLTSLSPINLDEELQGLLLSEAERRYLGGIIVSEMDLGNRLVNSTPIFESGFGFGEKRKQLVPFLEKVWLSQGRRIIEDQGQLKLVEVQGWPVTGSTLKTINQSLQVMAKVLELHARRTDIHQPIIVLDWGCGKGNTLIALRRELQARSIPNVILVGYSDEFYREWNEAPEGTTFILAPVTQLQTIYQQFYGSHGIDVIGSYLGVTHLIAEDASYGFMHLNQLRELLSPTGEMRIHDPSKELRRKFNLRQWSQLGGRALNSHAWRFFPLPRISNPIPPLDGPGLQADAAMTAVNFNFQDPGPSRFRDIHDVWQKVRPYLRVYKNQDDVYHFYLPDHLQEIWKAVMTGEAHLAKDVIEKTNWQNSQGERVSFAALNSFGEDEDMMIVPVIKIPKPATMEDSLNISVSIFESLRDQTLWDQGLSDFEKTAVNDEIARVQQWADTVRQSSLRRDIFKKDGRDIIADLSDLSDEDAEKVGSILNAMQSTIDWVTKREWVGRGGQRFQMEVLKLGNELIFFRENDPLRIAIEFNDSEKTPIEILKTPEALLRAFQNYASGPGNFVRGDQEKIRQALDHLEGRRQELLADPLFGTIQRLVRDLGHDYEYHPDPDVHFAIAWIFNELDALTGGIPRGFFSSRGIDVMLQLLDEELHFLEGSLQTFLSRFRKSALGGEIGLENMEALPRNQAVLTEIAREFFGFDGKVYGLSDFDRELIEVSGFVDWVRFMLSSEKAAQIPVYQPAQQLAMLYGNRDDDSVDPRQWVKDAQDKWLIRNRQNPEMTAELQENMKTYVLVKEMGKLKENDNLALDELIAKAMAFAPDDIRLESVAFKVQGRTGEPEVLSLKDIQNQTWRIGDIVYVTIWHEHGEDQIPSFVFVDFMEDYDISADRRKLKLRGNRWDLIAAVASASEASFELLGPESDAGDKDQAMTAASLDEDGAMAVERDQEKIAFRLFADFADTERQELLAAVRAWPDYQQQFEDPFEEIIARWQNGKTGALFAYQDGKPLGVIEYSPIGGEDYRGDKIAYKSGIFVHPDYRRGDIGLELTLELLNYLKINGYGQFISTENNGGPGIQGMIRKLESLLGDAVQVWERADGTVERFKVDLKRYKRMERNQKVMTESLEKEKNEEAFRGEEAADISGGVDWKSTREKLERRGGGTNAPLNVQEIERLNVEIRGLTPLILHMFEFQPSQIPMFLGMEEESEAETVLSKK